MKLLLDQNISFRLINQIIKYYPGSKQVKDVGLENTSDSEIWDYANKNGFTIVTFDSDFHDLSIIRGIPPKIIWLRMGNTSTLNIAHTLISNLENIRAFIQGESESEIVCLEIN